MAYFHFVAVNVQWFFEMPSLCKKLPHPLSYYQASLSRDLFCMSVWLRDDPAEKTELVTHSDERSFSSLTDFYHGKDNSAFLKWGVVWRAVEVRSVIRASEHLDRLKISIINYNDLIGSEWKTTIHHSQVNTHHIHFKGDIFRFTI